jgi:hypothetical protein
MTEPGSEPIAEAASPPIAPDNAGYTAQPGIAAAVEATSAAYTDDAQVDVLARLRSELDERGHALDERTF